MDRYPLLVQGFAVSLALSLTFLLFDTTASSLVISIGYFGFLFYFLFRTESIPTTYLNVPAVDYYVRNRFNRFNYSLLSYSVISAIVFSITIVYTSIPFGIIPFIFWVGLIVFIEWYKKNFPEDLEVKNMMVDFVSEQLLQEQINIENTLLNQIITLLQTDSNQAQQIANSQNIPPEVVLKISDLVQAYNQGVQEDLSRTEIEEIN